MNLPLVIHSRDSESDIIEELKSSDRNAILHCFSGTVKQAEEAISLGCIISIPASIAYSKQKQELARKIPFDRIVLETDAPYLPPVPKTRNEPANVKLAALKIAGLKGIDYSIVEKVTTENARKFFNLKYI